MRLRSILNVLIGLPAQSDVSLKPVVINRVEDHESRWTPRHVRIDMIRDMGMEPPAHLLNPAKAAPKKTRKQVWQKNDEGKWRKVWIECDPEKETQSPV